MISEGMQIALVTGLVSGLITWGGIRVQLAWLRRDVDAAHKRINAILGRDNSRGDAWPVDS